VRFLTDFADQAVILPMVLAVSAALFIQGWRRGALAWLVTVAATFGAILALKVTCLACSPLFRPMDMHSPSGHVAAATVVAGGFAGMLTRRSSGVVPAAVLAAMVIGVSRLWLGMHSVPEVMVGAMVGLIGAIALPRLAGPPPPLRLMSLMVTVVLVAVTFHGLHMPAEAAIRHTAWRIGRFIPGCREVSGATLSTPVRELAAQ
jgi:membrane-associated phospholipid phosphatase